jgi:hypothetical protein
LIFKVFSDLSEENKMWEKIPDNCESKKCEIFPWKVAFNSILTEIILPYALFCIARLKSYQYKATPKTPGVGVGVGVGSATAKNKLLSSLLWVLNESYEKRYFLSTHSVSI